MKMDQLSIGFIGLGSLGLPVAMNLLEKGHSLKVYNRTPQKAAPLVEKGAAQADSIPELAQSCNVVVSLVSNDDALQAITEGPEGIVENLTKDGVHISMSTVSPALADELRALHRQHDSFYVAAPILGRPEAARARQLSLCVAGHKDAKEKVARLWSDMGAQHVYDYGERPAAANVIKLCVNYMIAAQIEVMSEAFALSEKNGVPSSALFDMISQGLFNNPITKNYGALLLQHSFEPASFALELGLKDLNLVLDAAGSRGVSMPVANVVKDRLQQSIARGRGQMDWSAFSLVTKEEAGL